MLPYVALCCPKLHFRVKLNFFFFWNTYIYSYHTISIYTKITQIITIRHSQLIFTLVDLLVVWFGLVELWFWQYNKHKYLPVPDTVLPVPSLYQIRYSTTPYQNQIIQDRPISDTLPPVTSSYQIQYRQYHPCNGYSTISSTPVIDTVPTVPPL